MIGTVESESPELVDNISMHRPLKVVWLGLRGFPEVQGGIESHAQHLCPLLSEMGCEVHVITRRGYQNSLHNSYWHGVHFHNIWAPRSRSLETLVHTFLGVLYAGILLRPDLLHIQAIGPALMTPLARILGLRVVVTHHGPDYDRQKWGRLARAVLLFGERLGVRWSHEHIVISETIRKMILDRHCFESKLIPNGVAIEEIPCEGKTPSLFGLQRGKYIITVSRLVPEKRHLDLIAAFRELQVPGWKLAIVGALDRPDAYVREVLKVASSTPGVVCTGFQSGQSLRELYAHAGVFVLPSSHEGLPISILEALSYGLPVIASDIPGNLEVGLPRENYFPMGNVSALTKRLAKITAAPPRTLRARTDLRAWVAERFSWRVVAEQTLMVYRAVAKTA